jgi:hypothetical protein
LLEVDLNVLQNDWQLFNQLKTAEVIIVLSQNNEVAQTFTSLSLPKLYLDPKKFSLPGRGWVLQANQVEYVQFAY